MIVSKVGQGTFVLVVKTEAVCLRALSSLLRHYRLLTGRMQACNIIATWNALSIDRLCSRSVRLAYSTRCTQAPCAMLCAIQRLNTRRERLDCKGVDAEPIPATPITLHRLRFEYYGCTCLDEGRGTIVRPAGALPDVTLRTALLNTDECLILCETLWYRLSLGDKPVFPVQSQDSCGYKRSIA